jgi:hypothetical protein
MFSFCPWILCHFWSSFCRRKFVLPKSSKREMNHSIRGWLVVFRHPSEKWWSSDQLGWWNSQSMESHNPFMFQTTTQYVGLMWYGHASFLMGNPYKSLPSWVDDHRYFCEWYTIQLLSIIPSHPSPVHIWNTPIAWSQWNVEIPYVLPWFRLGKGLVG